MSKDAVMSMRLMHERITRLEDRVLARRGLGTHHGERGLARRGPGTQNGEHGLARRGLGTHHGEHGIDVYDRESGPRGNMTGVYVEWRAEGSRFGGTAFKFMLFIPGHNATDEDIRDFLKRENSNIIHAAKESLSTDRQRELMGRFEDDLEDTDLSLPFNVYGGDPDARAGIVMSEPYEFDEG